MQSETDREGCLFCKIMRGEIPTTKIYEDANTFAFLDIRPINPGHTLVIPKKHAPDIFEIKEHDWDAAMRSVRKVAHALEQSLNPAGINLAMNNRPGAGQVIFHAHVHVIPRFLHDGHELWKGKPYKEGEAENVARAIRAMIETSSTD